MTHASIATTQAAAHTPGPWAIATDDWWVYSQPTGKIVVGEVDTENKADYHLISAAPELLAALRECEGYCRGHQETPEKVARYQRVRAALSKAEGR